MGEGAEGVLMSREARGWVGEEEEDISGTMNDAV